MTTAERSISTRKDHLKFARKNTLGCLLLNKDQALSEN